MARILSLLVLVLVVYAIFRIVQSSAKTSEKILWSVLVLLLPVVGLIIWALLGPGSPLK